MEATGKKRKRRLSLLWRMFMGCAALAAAFVLGVFVVLPKVARWGHLNATVEETLSAVLGADVRVGGVEIRPASEVVVHEVKAFHPGESNPFLTVGRLVIGGDIASVMSGRYASVEASDVWLRMAVENGQPDWIPPEQEEKHNIPILNILDADVEIDLDGIPVRLRDARFVMTDFGGDLRTRIEGGFRPGGSSSEITLSGDFLVDDLPESASLELNADNIELRDISEIIDALNLPGIDVQKGRAGLRLHLHDGKAFAEISAADIAVRLPLHGDAILQGNMLLGIDCNLQDNTLTVSPESDNYVEVTGLGRLDVTAGSVLALGGGAPFLDFRLAASGVNPAKIVSLFIAPDDALLKEIRLSGNITAREIHLFGPLDHVRVEIESRLDDASFVGYGASIRGVSGPVRIKGTPEGNWSAQVNLHARHAEYDYDGNVAVEKDVDISGTVSLDPSEFMLQADATVTFSGGDRFECGGSVGLDDGRLEGVKLQSAGEIDSERVWSIVRSLFLPEMSDWKIEGKTEGKALIDTSRGEDGELRCVISWNADLRGCDAHMPFLDKPLRGLKGGIGAEIITGAALEEVRNITAELSNAQFERIAIARGLYRPPPHPPAEKNDGARFDVECSLKARRNRDALEIILGKAPGGEFLKDLLDWDMEVVVTAAGTENEFTVSLNSLVTTNAPRHAQGEPLRRFTMNGIAGHFRREGESMHISAAIPELDTDILWKKMRHMFPEWIRQARFKGTLQVDCKADVSDSGAWSGDITVSAAHEKPARALRYYSPDRENRFNLGDTKVVIHLERPAGSDVSVAAVISADGFQYVHAGESAFCFDMAEQPVHIKAEFDFRNGGEALHFKSALLHVASLGEVSLSGALNLESESEMDLFLKIEGLDARQLFRTLLVDNYSGKFDFLENLKVRGRVVSDGLRLRGPLAAPHLTGRVELHDVSIAYKDFAVENLHADLPVDLAFGDGEVTNPRARKGEITFSRFGAGPACVVSTRLPFRLVKGDLVFEEELVFRVPGGVLRADGFRINGVTPSRIAGNETAFQLSGLRGDIDLNGLTKELGWTRMDGTLEVLLENVVLAGEKISASGGMVMRAFGGEVELEHLSADNVFRGPASILFSADIKDVSLARVSKTFGFGEISGTLRGHVKDFEYVNNNANRFEIDLEVVDGERRYIRPDFLRDFVYINSGRIVDLPRNVIVSIGTRRRYAYKNFGIHAKMRNNYMKLSSNYKYRGKQAFMLAEWYGGVNIINAQPGRVYFWKPMYDRITAVLEGKTQPEARVTVRPGP